MGLIKKDGYILKGVEIKPAYAKIIDFQTIHSYNDEIPNLLLVKFGISTTRDNLDKNLVLNYEEIQMEYDRTSDDLFNQMYTKAKSEKFIDWEDDIQ